MTTALLSQPPATSPLPPSVAARLAEIQARAAARGFDVRPAATYRPRRHSPDADGSPRRPLAPSPQPLSPLDQATRRPLPNAWRRLTGTYRYGEVNRRELASELETEIAGRLIARCLGPAWVAERIADERRGRVHLRHVPTATRITFAVVWNDIGRWYASAEARRGQITFSRDRTPAAIAADIERRLLPGLFAENARMRTIEHQRRQETARRVRDVVRVTRALGGRVARKHHWQAEPHSRRRDTQGGDLATFEAEYDGGYRMAVYTHNVALCEELAAVFAKYQDAGR